ncbi:adenosylcobinamide-phosphate synthase CbiB [Veillonella sp. VA139]|uniref:adenosylcobinamide-phosphate synthase CbiB n=1 Tax=Veillonella sp. VA139 TaxID=741830 RepID=UPI000F8F6B94|nr:adenosylcobinamide-phosphate synthase CbiB [Veillonella sp. VA139]
MEWFLHHLVYFIPLGALVVDTMFGDPRSKYHPVVLIGNCISFYESILYKKNTSANHQILLGISTVLLVLMSVMIVVTGLLFIGGTIHPVAYSIVSLLCLYISISPRCLAEAGIEIANLLRKQDILEARRKVGWIVGRKTSDLDESEITRATIETVAENTVDGIISPLFWFVLLGPWGAIGYRAINTMDSMLGYKNDRYLYFGRFAARLDDVVNYIPARLTLVLFVIAAFLCGKDWKHALRIAARDSAKHPSPNGGYAEAPVAGALHIRLGGHNVYHDKVTFRAYMGDPIEPMVGRHIYQTIYLMYTVSILGVLCTMGSTYLINQW